MNFPTPPARLPLQQATQRLWTIRRLLTERAMDPLAARQTLRQLLDHPSPRIRQLALHTLDEVDSARLRTLDVAEAAR